MRIRALTLLLLSLICPRTFGQNSNDLKNKLIAYLDLSSIADRVRGAGTKAQNGTHIQSNSSNPTKQQYSSLYQTLTGLQTTRAGYLAALKLYIDGRNQHLPAADKQARLQALQDQVVLLKQGLAALASALEPLQISIDIDAPNLSDTISEYSQGQSGKVASVPRSVIATLTLPELGALQTQAIHNGETLKEAIEGLRKFIKQKYPDIS